MNNKKLFTIIAVVLVLAVGGAALYYGLRGDTNKSNTSDMSGMDMGNSSSSDSLVDTNSSTYKQYAAMTGEEYDRNFIANMIAHHEGAVTMAQLALTNAKHQELKDMANDIISAQNGEISQMKSWQQAWGYPSSSSDNMMDHSAMGMMDEMAGMENELKGKTGDESIAERVIDASRQHYAKKVEPEEVPTESKQEDTPRASKKTVKSKKKRASKKSDDELSAMKSVT